MTKDTEPKENVERGWESFVTVALAILFARLLSAWKVLPKDEAFLVAWSIAFLISYWIPPKPSESYGRWVLVRLTWIVGIYLTIFKAPVLLETRMSSFFAHAIPIVVLVALFILVRAKMKPS